jgi:hypothetical protein
VLALSLRTASRYCCCPTIHPAFFLDSAAYHSKTAAGGLFVHKSTKLHISTCEQYPGSVRCYLQQAPLGRLYATPIRAATEGYQPMADPGTSTAIRRPRPKQIASHVRRLRRSVLASSALFLIPVPSPSLTFTYMHLLTSGTAPLWAGIITLE